MDKRLKGKIFDLLMCGAKNRSFKCIKSNSCYMIVPTGKVATSNMFIGLSLSLTHALLALISSHFCAAAKKRFHVRKIYKKKSIYSINCSFS